MVSNYYSFTLGNKHYEIVRTWDRWFNINHRTILIDGEILNRDGLIPNAEPLSDEQVAELLFKVAKAKVRRRKIWRLRVKDTMDYILENRHRQQYKSIRKEEAI